MPEIFERSYTMNIQEKMEKYLGKAVSQADNKEIYHALLNIVQEMAAEKERTDSKKKVYYISAEFLIGKLLSNNMINLGIYGEVKISLRRTEKISVRLRKLNRSRLLETEGWDVWRHVFLTLSLHWDWPATESV